jgi:tetrapyrrole methylase family protein/MazG family protein/ATP diphosphatase
VNIMRRLLAPDGCPWDREQDEKSLRRYVLEEACEVIDAIDGGVDAELCDELGDLSLQVAFLAELGRRRGAFGPDDVMRSICEKLVRRHPHVFGDESAETAGQVEQSWERIKRQEKGGVRGLLDGVPRALPALKRADETSRRVAAVGFDWPDAEGARAKVMEELAELEAAKSEGQARVNEEFGDLLFALVNWSRHLGVDPELALRSACDKFRTRFEHVERTVREVHGDWPRDQRAKPTRGISLEELDGYWNASKRSST